MFLGGYDEVVSVAAGFSIGYRYFDFRKLLSSLAESRLLLQRHSASQLSQWPWRGLCCVLLHRQYLSAFSFHCQSLSFVGTVTDSTALTRPLFRMLVVALVVVVLVVVLAWHFFFRADGDFTLMFKGEAPRRAVEDKVVWVVGASQNIGEEIAKEYARLGAKLILTARRVEELERVKASLTGRHAPEKVVVLPGDISLGVEQLKELVQRAEAAFGGIDIVVQNAACPRPKLSAVEFPDDVLQRTFDVNVLGVIRLTQLLLPGMLNRGSGQFVVVSSVAGKVPSPGQTVYSASKHALNGYFNSLRSEVLQRGVTVTLACPGPIDTPRAASEAAERKVEKRLPVRRCAELIVRAGAHDLMEAWITYQPILSLLYVMQYVPALAFYVVNKVGPKRVQSYNEGSGGYNMRSLFKKSG